MKIAVTAETNNGLESTIAQHFGHAPFFILIDLSEGKVTSVNGIENPFAEKHDPGQIPGFIKEQKADVMLCGGIGGRAIQFFQEAGIQTATGASGSVRQSLENYLGGNMSDAAPCDESVKHGH